ncbi:MAG: hypothetical protein IJI85_10275 [Clostridia bacterium]|nr:hypothetical protein [Lentisphaeria bacterium]MBR0422946.1 hypothetical protein [Clostridia bacterium]
MQLITYTIDAGLPLSLWRGIPAQITLKGLPDVSGDWLFLIDTDWIDGVVLSGSVTASGSDLVVTLSETNTVELAHAIQGREAIPARATLTDSTSRVYLIPLTIRNRAIEGTPTPVANYYTKPQIDALIAGITAEDVGALSASGPEIAALEGTSIALAEGKVFRHTLAAGEVFTFDASGLTATRQVTGEVHLIQPATAVSFTLPAGILWEADGAFASGTDAPDFSTGSTLYALVFRWDGTNILGNLAYTKAV